MKKESLPNSKHGFNQSKKDKIIERQLRFQDLLISVSTTYINSDLSDIDKLIKESLQQIGEFVECDRSYIFNYDFINNTTSNTYEWCAKGIEPEIKNLQNIPIDYIPQWIAAHKNGEAFYVEDVSELPNDGEMGLRAVLEPQGIKSLITIPKIKNNELIGFIGFDAVKKINKYTENEKDILFVFANMLVNVIQRKEYEERIKAQKKKKEELLQSLYLQNEELNEYAHVVSHDLKAPLINIHTLIGWFMEDHKNTLNETDLKPLHQVLFNVEKMDFLIKGILDYSTIDKLEAEDKQVNFNTLVDEVLQTLLVPDHISITVQDNLPSIFGNPWRFKQVFQNLIQNAINYSDKDKGLIEVGYTEHNNHYEFFIKDNGVGIKPEYFERIFKVFTKLESTSSSSGIGLSIVKKIITYYKGNIWLESQEGSGTTFYFTLLKA
ncbi:GHKL domain-containing protein [Winogradskyella psychrotolerans]|uniref:GAF domain-containing sensor histidine kinase n=1 Tax=Winogradskyella psychrotolerans TaxID=1344585 RepID=UPI001C07C40F|nr:ATP-binding protein [Winogradskyella psychrotolerans]MBU2921099.1 GHKL domain-containing protein [Winogradskyella psychrotolerans]